MDALGKPARTESTWSEDQELYYRDIVDEFVKIVVKLIEDRR